MYFKNINLLIVVMLILIFNAYKVNAQINSNPSPTPTNFISHITNFPTPDWDHMTRGKDYFENYIGVKLKQEITSIDKDRVLKLMASIGKVKVHKHDIKKSANPEKFSKILKKFSPDIYEIKITNGISEKEACNIINTDPAVLYASPCPTIQINSHPPE